MLPEARRHIADCMKIADANSLVQLTMYSLCTICNLYLIDKDATISAEKKAAILNATESLANDTSDVFMELECSRLRYLDNPTDKTAAENYQMKKRKIEERVR